MNAAKPILLAFLHLFAGNVLAQEVEKKDHPILFNVVEEMTIAAQLPKAPRVYVVDDPSPNAFATTAKLPRHGCIERIHNHW